MKDVELLRFAGRAYELRDGCESWWNPLTDDAAAFRLANRLRIDIQWHHDSGYVEAYLSNQIGSPVIRELFVGNVDYAARRVIVRAAAEIGRSMP